MFPANGNSQFTGRALLSLSQLRTFLTLVEFGSMSGVSALLGLGPSTISAHVKAIEEALGQRLFDRSSGGMISTAVGSEAYHRFRPLLTRFAFCVDYVRRCSPRPPREVDVILPEGFAGTPFDFALGAVSRAIVQHDPDLCLLPGPPKSPAKNDAVRVSYIEPGRHGSGLVRDRWVLVRGNSAAGWREAPLAQGALAGVPLLVPCLPPPLRQAASVFAEQVGARFIDPEMSFGQMLAQASQFPNFCALAPAGLISVGMHRRPFEFIPIEPTVSDPTIAIHGGPALIQDALRAELTPRLARPLSGLTPAETDHRKDTDALSLKHARSFLALYEEGNVGRAAQRLCLVQPAVTVQLHQIEELFGGTLFARTHLGLRANAQADLLYSMLRPLMDDFNSATQDLRIAETPRARPLRVGLMPALDDESLMTEGFVTALERWTQRHRADVPQVVEAYSSTLVRWVHEGRIDFAVIDQIVSDAMLEVDSVAADSMAVVVGADSVLLPPGPVALREIVKLPLVLPSSRHGLRSLLSHYLREIGLSLEPKAEVDSMAAALKLVKIGAYATILPMGSVYKSRRRRHLRVHEIREPRIIRHICLARARRGPSSDDVRNLMDELRVAFRSSAATMERSASRSAQFTLSG